MSVAGIHGDGDPDNCVADCDLTDTDGEKRMPEVDLTLNKFNIRNLSVNLTEYQPFNYQYIYTLHDCPSDKIVSCALKELNQWVSGYYLVLDG